jgi:CTP synthase
MQLAVIEFARSICGLKGASSSEVSTKEGRDLVIDLMPDQRGLKDKGGTMRLGAYACVLKAGTRTAELYGKREVSERHRHRFEFNNDYREVMARAGLVFSGTSPDERLVEIIELPDHPHFIGCQFHPEFTSRPMSAHPLFSGFVAAAVARRDELAASARNNQDSSSAENSMN